MMRRQVKPFVTEYRGTPRRTKDHSAGGDAHQEAPASRSRSYAEAQKHFQPDSPEDSYEAAMRAADALFSSDRSEPPLPAEPSLFRETFSRGDDAAVEEAVVPSFREERQPEAAPRRILQAIEPPQEDRFAALEAERAPKRRGRKPGSKNKPKVQLGDDWAAAIRPVAASAPTPPTARTRAAPAQAAPRFSLADFIEDDDEEPEVELAEVDVPADDAALPPPRGRTDKFGWKREGLRPGERWKRRLPKAAR